MNAKSLMAASVCALALAAGSSHAATTIYNETFSGTTGTPLAGTATPTSRYL